MAQPLVTVCIPTIGRSQMLGETLESLRLQTYSNYEVLILDNACSADGQEVIYSYVGNESRARVLRSEKRLHMFENFSRGIEAANGRYLTFFHDDDIYEPYIISCNATFLLKHSEVGIVCSDWDLIDAFDRQIGIRRYKVKSITLGLNYIEQTLHAGRSSICCSGALIRRSALGDIRFDPKGSIGFSDFVIWFQIAERYSIGHISKILFHYRIHELAFSHRTITSISTDYHQTLLRYCGKHLEHYPKHLKTVNKWKTYINRFLFWALAYELGLHFRKIKFTSFTNLRNLTVFEISQYQLTKDEYEELTRQLDAYQNSLFQRAALKIIKILLCFRLTWLLGWITKYPSLLRRVMGFK